MAYQVSSQGDGGHQQKVASRMQLIWSSTTRHQTIDEAEQRASMASTS
jgi:hypothetical protein